MAREIAPPRRFPRLKKWMPCTPSIPVKPLHMRDTPSRMAGNMPRTGIHTIAAHSAKAVRLFM